MKTHPEPEQLSAYLDDEVDASERRRIESHLRTCSTCSATMTALRATVADLHELPSPEPSGQVSWALRSAVARARKAPAKRYQRWVMAAGSVAAVAIAIVVITQNNSPKKATVTNALQAPAAAAQASLVSVENQNFDETSASDLLSPPSTFGADTAVNGTSAGGSESQQKSATSLGGTPAPASQYAPASEAQLDAYLQKIQSCEQQLFANDTTVRTAVRYVVARFKNTPSYLLVYTVGSGSNAKTELWIVQQKDCFVRYYLPPR